MTGFFEEVGYFRTCSNHVAVVHCRALMAVVRSSSPHVFASKSLAFKQGLGDGLDLPPPLVNQITSTAGKLESEFAEAFLEQVVKPLSDHFDFSWSKTRRWNPTRTGLGSKM
jgi:hypothetical protein